MTEQHSSGTATADGPERSPPAPTGSPDRLDQVVRITDTRSALAVAIGLAAVAGALLWAFVGTLSERTSVTGIMVRDGALVEIFAPEAGRVTSVDVEPGDEVAAGATIGALDVGSGDPVDITTPSSGVVQGVAMTTGGTVAAGDEVATVLDPQASAPLRAITYVDPAQAEQFRAIENVTVVPESVDAASFGSLEGRIDFVASVPASQQGMAGQLGSRALAESFAEAAGGVPFLVTITFDDPPVWTGGDAPPFEITDRTIAEISAIVERERPIDRLFGG